MLRRRARASRSLRSPCCARARRVRAHALDWTVARRRGGARAHALSPARHDQPARQRAHAPRTSSRQLFERDGIDSQIFESAPGPREHRGAALAATARSRRSCCMHHMDVVPADARFWQAHAVRRRDPRRRACGGAARSTTRAWARERDRDCSRCAREHAPLASDVIFLGVADEEAGGALGAGFMVEQHFDLFANAGVVLNEGGYIATDDAGAVRYYAVETAQKVPLWLRLTATGSPGHGSMPRARLGAEPPARRARRGSRRGRRRCASSPSCSASTPTPHISRPTRRRERLRDLRAALAESRRSRPSSPRTRARTRRCATRSR